jgi:hypothetical protein
MANLRLISRLIGLSSVLMAALFAFRSRGTVPPERWVGASETSDNEEREHIPAWPPMEGVYWGM